MSERSNVMSLYFEIYIKIHDLHGIVFLQPLISKLTAVIATGCKLVLNLRKTQITRP